MKRIFSSSLKVTVTLALLYWVFNRYGLGHIGGKVVRADYRYLALAAAIFSLSNFVGALQWQKLLHGLRISFEYRRALNLYFIGLFFNTILPGSLGGDVVKIYSINRVEKKGREGLAATFVDRFAGFFMLALFAIGASVYLSFTHLLSGRIIKGDILIYVATIFVVFMTTSIVLFSRRIGRLIYEVLLARVNPLGLKDRFREVHEFFHAYRHQYRLGTGVFLLSLVIQLARVAVHYYCALAIGFDIDFVYFLIFVPLIAMAAIVPVSFGGLGVREGTAPFLFTSVAAVAAVDPLGSLAVTTQLLASLVGIVVGLIGGVLFIFTRSSVKTEIQEAEESGTIPALK